MAGWASAEPLAAGPARLPPAVRRRRPLLSVRQPADADDEHLHDAGVRPGARHPLDRHAPVPDADRGRRDAADGAARVRAQPAARPLCRLDRAECCARGLRARHRGAAPQPPLPDGGDARPRRLPRLRREPRDDRALRRAMGADLSGLHLPAAPDAWLDRDRGRADPVRADARQRVDDRLPAQARQCRGDGEPETQRKRGAQRRGDRQHGHAAQRAQPLAGGRGAGSAAAAGRRRPCQRHHGPASSWG